MEKEKKVYTRNVYQQVFNKVVKHLIKQGRRAVENGTGTSCKYRGDKGTSCAVGCLISDSYYNRSMEGSGILDNPPAQRAVLRSLKRKVDKSILFRLLRDLQEVHDVTMNGTRNDVVILLREIADDFGLTMPKEAKAWENSDEPASPV